MKSVKPITDIVLKLGLLLECESEYNAPNLTVQNGLNYSLVQYLQSVNKIAGDLHPVVANPYALLTKFKNEYRWFTVSDLEDAFFCIPLDPGRQNLFAFEWGNLETGRRTQLPWTI